jgi:hypothetical protein
VTVPAYAIPLASPHPRCPIDSGLGRFETAIKKSAGPHRLVGRPDRPYSPAPAHIVLESCIRCPWRPSATGAGASRSAGAAPVRSEKLCTGHGQSLSTLVVSRVDPPYRQPGHHGGRPVCQWPSRGLMATDTVPAPNRGPAGSYAQARRPTDARCVMPHPPDGYSSTTPPPGKGAA